MADILDVDLWSQKDVHRTINVKVKALRGRVWKPMHLDQREGKHVTDHQHAENDGYAGETHFRMVVLSARIRDVRIEATDELVYAVIQNLFDSGGCWHGYDCCGCISSRAWGQRVSKREWKIVIRHHRNM